MNRPFTFPNIKLNLFYICICLTTLSLVSCGNDNKIDKQKPSANVNKTSKIDLTLTGEELFVKNCKLCHGINGQLQLNGAKDLRESVMTLEERVVVIKEGKNAMTPFKKILSDEEIRKVAEYSLSFKKTE